MKNGPPLTAEQAPEALASPPGSPIGVACRETTCQIQRHLRSETAADTTAPRTVPGVAPNQEARPPRGRRPLPLGASHSSQGRPRSGIAREMGIALGISPRGRRGPAGQKVPPLSRLDGLGRWRGSCGGLWSGSLPASRTGAKVRSAQSSWGGWPQLGRARDELARRNVTVAAKRKLETARKGK